MTTSNLSYVGETNPDGKVMGKDTSDKIAFHGSTPIVQRSGSAQTAIATTVAKSSTTSTEVFGFASSTQANAIVTLANECRAALVALGLIKGSA